MSERGWNEWGRSVILANVSVISVHFIIILITFDNTRRCAPLALSVADLSAPLLSRVGSLDNLTIILDFVGNLARRALQGCNTAN